MASPVDQDFYASVIKQHCRVFNSKAVRIHACRTQWIDDLFRYLGIDCSSIPWKGASLVALEFFIYLESCFRWCIPVPESILKPAFVTPSSLIIEEITISPFSFRTVTSIEHRGNPFSECHTLSKSTIKILFGEDVLISRYFLAMGGIDIPFPAIIWRKELWSWIVESLPVRIRFCASLLSFDPKLTGCGSCAWGREISDITNRQ